MMTFSERQLRSTPGAQPYAAKIIRPRSWWTGLSKIRDSS
jgi:hypothetical protein